MRKFTKAIEEATKFWLEADPDFQVFGIGADYPNGLDGTSGLLAAEFPGRILDTPLSESSFTGLALGRAISGKRTLVHHGRAEFAIFAADQIFTQAAKWRYQFGGETDVWLTIRIALGRQWGNGPQHTASYLQHFSSVPGLKVFIPSSPNQAHALLKLAIELPDPVIFAEPRWLYQTTQSTVLTEKNRSHVDGFEKHGVGESVAILTYGEGVLDTLSAVMQHGLSETITVFDCWDVTPGALNPTKIGLEGFERILVYDPYCTSGGPLVDLALSATTMFPGTQVHLVRPPSVPIPTAPSLAASYYPNSLTLLQTIERVRPNITLKKAELTFEKLHLPPKARIGAEWETIEF